MWTEVDFLWRVGELNTAEPPRAELHFGEDITLDDVKSLESYLTIRTATLAQAAGGSDERKAARSIRMTLLMLTETLNHCLSVNSPEDRGSSRVRAKVILSWNALWMLASSWRMCDDFNHERWRTVKFWNMEDAREFEARLRAISDRTELPDRD
ncbi:hypothetical protein [Streptomyces sp. NPDC054854]